MPRQARLEKKRVTGHVGMSEKEKTSPNLLERVHSVNFTLGGEDFSFSENPTWRRTRSFSSFASSCSFLRIESCRLQSLTGNADRCGKLKVLDEEHLKANQ